MQMTKSEAGKLGALVTHSRYDRREITSSARRAFLEKFLAQVDPENVLSLEERNRRAQFALRAHMRTLAARSAEARRRMRSGAVVATKTEAESVSTTEGEATE